MSETAKARDSRIEALEDVVATLWLHIGHHAESQLTTEQKEILADAVDAQRTRQDPQPTDPGPQQFDRWWRHA